MAITWKCRITSGSDNFTLDYNQYKPDEVATGYHVDLESLYVQYRLMPVHREHAKLRLFAAFYNAMKLKMGFGRALRDATTGVRRHAKNGQPLPWLGTISENYYRSYAGSYFIDGFLSDPDK